MTYPPQDSRFTSQYDDRRVTGKRSVAETLVETLSETLGQASSRPSFSQARGSHRRRIRPVAGLLAMLAGLAALGFAFLRPAADRRPATGNAIAFLEITRGQVGLAGTGSASPRLLTLAGGEPIYAGTVIDTAAANRAAAGRAAAGRAAIRLAGGQSVRLDTSSRVRFASRSDLVLERGAVYVDSAGGANIEVRTSLGVVRDVGTQFEVRLLDDANAQPSLRVRVREGSIMLEREAGSDHALAGEELSARGDGRVERGRAAIFGPHWRWVLDTAPTPEIAGRPLADFLDWVSREGGWTVRYADAETARIASSTVLHGDVRNLDVAEASSMVLHGSGLDYRLEDGTFVVEPRDEE